MNKFITELKFQATYYGKNVLGYFADVANALLGRTRRQAKFLEGIVDASISSMARLAAENAKLQNQLDAISKNTVKPSKKKASPKQGQ